MINTIRRQFTIYGAYAAMMPKMFLAYSIWVWMSFFVNVLAIIIFVAFWTAVYGGGTEAIAGLRLNDTLNYIIMAQIFMPAASTTQMLYYFGDLMREGRVGIELLRPLDFQAANYISNLSQMLLSLALQLPLAVVAWLLFRFQLPTDPLVWIAFAITLLLGNALLFCFDWILGCISFYSTETWGLMVLRFGIAGFFSGVLVPLVMMPDWLRTIAEILPFAQALYVPVSILSGITPVAEAPGIWLEQVLLLVGFGLASRIIFKIAVRKVTVQGG